MVSHDIALFVSLFLGRWGGGRGGVFFYKPLASGMSASDNLFPVGQIRTQKISASGLLNPDFHFISENAIKVMFCYSDKILCSCAQKQ